MKSTAKQIPRPTCIFCLLFIHKLRFNGLKVSIFCHMDKRKAPWRLSRGPNRFRALVRRLRFAASGCGCSPLALRKHGAGLLAGAGVDVVVAEENLRGRGAGSAVLGHVVRTDVDSIGGGLFHELDAGGLGMGAGDTVGLAFGGLDDQVDAAVVGEGLVQLEGEGVTLYTPTGSLPDTAGRSA